MRNAPGAGRRRWRPHRRRDRAPAHPTPRACTPSGQTMADAMQQAIGLLTATLDSPALQTWAVAALIPDDPSALGDFLAGMHVVSQLLLQELDAATGRPAAATLQHLALLAESMRGTPLTG
jgi:hypothetical protein